MRERERERERKRRKRMEGVERRKRKLFVSLHATLVDRVTAQRPATMAGIYR